MQLTLRYHEGVDLAVVYRQKTAVKISSVTLLSLRAESSYVQPEPIQKVSAVF